MFTQYFTTQTSPYSIPAHSFGRISCIYCWWCIWSIWIVRVVSGCSVVISRVTILVIYVVLGHFYTVFHFPDLPRLAPSTLLWSHMMYTLLVVGMVYLESQGCVWVVSYDLTSDDFGDIRVLRSFVHPISLPRPETHPYRPPLVLCGVHTRTSGSGVFGW